MAAVVDRLGRLDVLVNAVGTHIEQPAQDVTPEAWDRVVDLNLDTNVSLVYLRRCLLSDSMKSLQDLYST